MIQTFKSLLFLITPSEYKNTSLLLLMILLMAFLDMIGVAAIVPFITVLTNPDLINTNNILNFMFQTSVIFGIENTQQFASFLGVLVFIFIIISLAFKALTTYVQVKFIHMLEFKIAKRLVEGYLHQPYSWFLSRNSADLGKNILSEVGAIVGNGMSPLMELIAKSTVAVALIILLIIADPILALIVGFSLGGAYVIVFYFIRNYLNKIGEERFKSNRLRFTALSEAFGAAKEVKFGGLEEVYIKNFSNPAKIFAQVKASSDVLAQLPRFIVEAVAFGGILLIILYKMQILGNFYSFLPIVSLYVFAGYRLMPALQQIYNSFTMLTFNGPSIKKLTDDIKSLKQLNTNQNNNAISFNDKISLKNIFYNYPNSSRTALKNINISINAKTTVGLVGVTGSGKTTTVDILLGLLEPKKGVLQVDEKIITKQNARSWQRSIGYVPQYIYLADDSIAANIAFGVDTKNINFNSIERASKIANLHDFVINELPQNYNTIVGERGIRLSGGQRQRIGIARALYHNPQVLFLDEGTSALDNQTEKLVMEAVNNLSKDITIIIIAHRLNTVKNCDVIFKLDKGEVIGQGTFEELIKGSKSFNNNL